MLPIIFFLLQGIVLPNFDDLHYCFLTEVIGMPKYTYDFLNVITYVACVIFTAIYNQCFAWVQVHVLILVSLLLILVMTTLMLINATRLNLEWGISDIWINALIFFFGT